MIRIIFKSFFTAFLIITFLNIGFGSVNGIPADFTDDVVTIFYNGTILTVDKNMTEAEAMAIKNDRILSVGTKEEVFKFKTSNSILVDLKGKTLMPGFVETHSHPINKMIIENYTVDIRPTTGHLDGNQIMETIKKTIANAKPDDYLIFFGWDPVLQKGLKNPKIQELDSLAPDNPLLIWGNSNHIAFANSKAFKLAGIDKNTPNPGGTMGGTFEHDKNGELTGRMDQGGPILLVVYPFFKTIFHNSEIASEAMYKAWLQNASDGVTTIVDDVLMKDFMKIYLLTAKNFKSIRIRCTATEYADWDPFQGDDLIKVIGGKIFIDGSPWTGTITMSKPYLVNDLTVNTMETPAGYFQQPYVNQNELQAFIDEMIRTRRSAAIHAEGDSAIQMALDAIEEGLRKQPWDDHRFRLLHIPLIRDDQIERAKKLGVQLSFLMAHVKYWGDVIPILVGEERGIRWCPVGSAIKYGANFSFHFDGPTSPNKPLETLETVTTRKTLSGNVLGSVERISIDDAIRGYTINAAFQLFMDKEVGSLEKGKYADFIILSDNPRKVPLETISQIKILETYIGGEKFWSMESK